MKSKRNPIIRFALSMALCLNLGLWGLVAHSGLAYGIDFSQTLAEAQQGEKNSAYLLGVMYHTGSGVNQDCHQALKWTNEAALQGHILAQSHLGTLYRNGCEDKVNKDALQAYFWTALAAKKGLQIAKQNLLLLEEQLHPYLLAEMNQKVDQFKPKQIN
ncbi:MAG: sel1 repeat family protein [Deltaproteobacteria bacterium]|jgi:TPR repeat protein|nr:sel1 repeat family protein [Deltaproteobacteria bacterium]MBW2504043.1 sel1 repeat family protein [Deltaproteobacteria bacterium]MBW2519093.1 sel1 repeat family protein [Deltaproteobacteria bacterium]